MHQRIRNQVDLIPIEYLTYCIWKCSFIWCRSYNKRNPSKLTRFLFFAWGVLTADFANFDKTWASFFIFKDEKFGLGVLIQRRSNGHRHHLCTAGTITEGLTRFSSKLSVFASVNFKFGRVMVLQETSQSHCKLLLSPPYTECWFDMILIKAVWVSWPGGGVAAEVIGCPSSITAFMHLKSAQRMLDNSH